MCVAVPARVIAVEHLTATIEVQGASRDISLMLLPDLPVPGDYVLVHAGFAIQRLDPASARESLALFADLARQMAANP
ncbi:MAG: hydrogenase assembly protein HypC [Desulfobulbaceae bacterium A2]|nr:MAG: hydrogenase assembly protein HypC [Desulfobulbaceae bacterium A2]